MRLTALAVAACTALGVAAIPASAGAAETESALLSCGSGGSYQVTGFGRGEPLHLVGSTRVFVVTYARLDASGSVVTDIRGQQGREEVLTCTATTPTGTAFTFQGFLTPRP